MRSEPTLCKQGRAMVDYMERHIKVSHSYSGLIPGYMLGNEGSMPLSGTMNNSSVSSTAYKREGLDNKCALCI